MSDGYTLLLAGVFVTQATPSYVRPITDPSTPVVAEALARVQGDRATVAARVRKGARA
jgi:hypothetical protein